PERRRRVPDHIVQLDRRRAGCQVRAASEVGWPRQAPVVPVWRRCWSDGHHSRIQKEL
ncbi:hypothetical protein EC988_009276, partial [Linderina pennispora]